MKDNIRENLFNILGSAVRGAICYDLFSGTGALAFESISRGANRAVVVEQSRHATKFIQQTAEELGIEKRMRLIQGDAFRLSGELLGPPEDDTPWVVFLSPPYALWIESLPELSAIIRTVLQNAPPGSVLVAETDHQFDTGNLPAGDWDIREYGGTRLAFIEPAMRCGMEW
jgi:16S rRNA (guanine966-N2)-methyltransferase